MPDGKLSGSLQKLKIGTKLYGLTAQKVHDDTERDFSYKRYVQ